VGAFVCLLGNNYRIKGEQRSIALRLVRPKSKASKSYEPGGGRHGGALGDAYIVTVTSRGDEPTGESSLIGSRRERG